MRHLDIDVHAKTSELYEVSASGMVVRRERMATTRAGLRRRFEGAARSRMVVECSGSTPWIVRLLESFGHEVVVVNPRRVRLIAGVDAEVRSRRCRDPGAVVMPRSGAFASGLSAELRGAAVARPFRA